MASQTCSVDPTRTIQAVTTGAVLTAIICPQAVVITTQVQPGAITDTVTVMTDIHTIITTTAAFPLCRMVPHVQMTGNAEKMPTCFVDITMTILMNTAVHITVGIPIIQAVQITTVSRRQAQLTTERVTVMMVTVTTTLC